ncbi:MAG: glycerophosphodiester phosphodiesterase [Clostridia bacterium]|nr:glycerophosphodiester phosphodiesterase [Clostridia bacterium]
MLNIAHRGFSGKYPENTILAFQKAIEAGADGAELDVHLTKDNVLVVIHDETINRTTGEEGFVADYTYDEISKFDASASFKDVYGFNKIPTLREYFELVKPVDGFITNIELKTGINEYPGIETAVFELIKEFSLEDRIIISSFNHYSVMRFKAIAPGIKCGYLTGDWIYNFGEYTKNRGVECVHPGFNSLNSNSVAEIKANGVQINTWTVNEAEHVERLYKLGVDSVITNYPDMAKAVIDRLNSEK